jgi:outer membrane protein assembly factor BamB
MQRSTVTSMGGRPDIYGELDAKMAWVLLLSVILLACRAQGNEPLIEELIFGRGIVAVRTNGTVSVRKVRVYEDGKEKCSRDDPGPSREIMVDLDWQEGRQYRVDLLVKGRPAPLVAESTAPPTPSPLVRSRYDLEEVDPHQLWDYTYIGGIVRFSPDGRFLALGSEKGYLRLFDVESGRMLWQTRIGEGRIVSMGFSPDGRRLAVGEQSREAFLYLYDLEGQRLWMFNGTVDVGVAEPGQTRSFLPAVDSLAFAPSGQRSMVYISVRRYLGPADTAFRHMGKLYGLDAESGQVVWAWPAAGCMDASPDCLHLDSGGQYLVFSNYWKGNTYNQSLYCLRAAKGSLLWSWDYRHPFPENRLGIWHGVDISADGRFVAALTGDGRGFFMDHSELIRTGGEGGVLWEKVICAPLDAGDLSVFAFPALAKVSGDYVAFTTGNTKSWQGKKQPTIEHPAANSLFVFDRQGGLRYTSPIGGASYTEAIHTSTDGRFMVFPIRYNRSRKDAMVHGVFLFDHSAPAGTGSRLLWFCHTEGMCLTADVSPDGKHVAALEYPVDVDMRDEFEEVKGAHRLHLLR